MTNERETERNKRARETGIADSIVGRRGKTGAAPEGPRERRLSFFSRLFFRGNFSVKERTRLFLPRIYLTARPSRVPPRRAFCSRFQEKARSQRRARTFSPGEVPVRVLPSFLKPIRSWKRVTFGNCVGKGALLLPTHVNSRLPTLMNLLWMDCTRRIV